MTTIKQVKERLDSQKGSSALILNDQILSDEGSRAVAEFLSKNPNFTSLELKGNNINSRSFAGILNSLHDSRALQTIIAQWNNIGQSSDSLQALQKLLEINPSIQNVDFKNNSIKPQGAKIIAQILQKNQSLLSLDLKWNNIGQKGGQIIADALQRNTVLKYLDLSCNKISENIIAQINRILNRNRTGTAIQQNNPNDNNRPSSSDSQRKPPLPPSERRNIENIPPSPTHSNSGSNHPSQLEDILNRERKRVADMKERVEQEIEEERRIRNELETNLVKLKEEVIRKQGLVSQMEYQHDTLLSQNAALRQEIDVLQSELNRLQDITNRTIEDLQEQLAGNNRQLTNLEKSHLHEVDNIISEHERMVNDLIRDWTHRYNVLDDKYRQLRDIKEQLEEQINEVSENMLRMRMDQEETLRNLRLRILQDEQKKYNTSLKMMEDRLKSSEDLRESAQRKNQELIDELKNYETKHFDQVKQLENEIHHQREEINKLHSDISQSNIELGFLKQEHTIKDDQIARLEDEVDDLQHHLQREKDSIQEKLDFAQSQHDNDRRIFQENMEHQHLRISELERAIRNQQAENARAQSQYQKLSNNLQNNISRAILETLAYYQNALNVPPPPYPPTDPGFSSRMRPPSPGNFR